MYRHKILLSLAASLGAVHAQVSSSWPHDYPGMPSGDFSAEWQSYFEVNETIPGVTFPIQRNWAGNIPVDRADHPNNTLFFWAWEKQNGSFTAESDEPWGIWLNGGPGSSSLLGLFVENGPLHYAVNQTLSPNNNSWSNIADYIWIDNPVGTGFSTADEGGFIADEDQTAADFMNFLSNLVKVFPNLKSRPLHLTGESYAGTYIPYITKAYFGMEDPPVNLAAIAIGNPTIGSKSVSEDLPTVTTIETYPQLIGYDPQVYAYFKEQSHLCGYDINLTYPQTGGHFRTLRTPSVQGDDLATQHEKRNLVKRLLDEGAFEKRGGVDRREEAVEEQRVEKREMWKRDLSARANGTIDPWYECDLHRELIDYALNFSMPWQGHNRSGFDVYNIPDALDPEVYVNGRPFLNNDSTRFAIHAPTSKNWSLSIDYPFGSINNSRQDPSPAPMAFLTDLATNATERGVRIVIFSGNDDSLVPHTGSEVVIQNTTFGGHQGFRRRPSTPWYGDDGEFAGIVHQERNWTYVLLKGAGHLAPREQPERAFVLAREFIFGNNQTGLLTNSNGTRTVVGGEVPTLAVSVLPGQDGIYVGSSSTQSTYTYPSATIAAWQNFIATVTTESFAPLPTGALDDSNAAGSVGVSLWAVSAALVGVGMALL